MVPIESSAKDLENILKALPTIPGGVSVTQEVKSNSHIDGLIFEWLGNWSTG